jgi:hypothetical protein
MKALTVVDALAEGVISVPVSLWDGAKRTGEGLAFWNAQEEVKIGRQNDRAFHAVKGLIDYGIYKFDSPLQKLVRIILFHYYESLSSSDKEVLQEAVGKKMIYLSSRIYTSANLSVEVAARLTSKIVATSAVKSLYRNVTKIEFTLLTAQGLLYKAGAASDRLKAKFPKIWHELMLKDLDMLYFIVEKPMQKYLEAIRMNRMGLSTKLKNR